MTAEANNLESTASTDPARTLALWEILSVVTSGLLVEWLVLSFVGRSKVVGAIPVLLALGLMFYSHLERGETLKDVGVRTDNFIAAVRLLLVPTGAAVFLIIAVAWFSRHSVFVAPWRDRYVLLPLWALFQQYVLNGFINRRAQLALGKGFKSIGLVALVFAVLHLPNPLLSVVTLIGGVIWAAVYQRQPNLFALALSHAVTSISLALSISPDILNNLRVGFKYFG